MFRTSCLLLISAVLASTSAVGAEFRFNARVTVLPSLSVAASPTGDETSEPTALAMTGTQDQCLDVHWAPAPGLESDPPDLTHMAPAGALIRLDGEGRGTFSAANAAVPAGATLQITLN